MNLLTLNANTYTGFCWVPDCQKEQVHNALADLKKRDPNGEHAEIHELEHPSTSPPTYFETNNFTSVF